MTNDLREIAQQIIDCENGSACWWDSDGPESGPAYAVKLARAWLAKHPADDDEPVTREWLESMDLSDSLCMRNEKRYELINGIRIVFFPCEYPQLWRSEIWTGGGHCHIKQNPTRGDVRRLLAALGIEVPK